MSYGDLVRVYHTRYSRLRDGLIQCDLLLRFEGVYWSIEMAVIADRIQYIRKIQFKLWNLHPLNPNFQFAGYNGKFDSQGVGLHFKFPDNIFKAHDHGAPLGLFQILARFNF